MYIIIVEANWLDMQNMQGNVSVICLSSFSRVLPSCQNNVNRTFCESQDYAAKLDCGIRQGGVLSPYLFAIYIDSLTEKIKKMS